MYNDKIVLACEKTLPNCLFIFASEYKSVEPKSPYCLITLVSETPSSTAEKTFYYEQQDDEPVVEIVNKSYEVLYNFAFHGKSDSESEHLARKFSNGLESSFYYMAFMEQGFGILSSTVASRVNQPIDVVNYIRDVVIVNFSVNRIDSFESDYIEKIEADGLLNDIIEIDVDVDYGI